MRSQTDFADGLQPLNLASNANLKTEVPDWIFRSLQLLLRNELRRRDIQHYVANSANAKTVLSVSAAATRLSASRRRLSASTHVYPFVSTLREILHDRLISLIGPESSTQSQVSLTKWVESQSLTVRKLPTLKAVEDIHVHLRIIEAHAMSDSFDYSSTQLLAGWLLPKLQQFTPLAAALEKLNGLAQAVEITTGLGQSEIWGLFLDSASASPTFPHELLQTLKSVEDRGEE